VTGKGLAQELSDKRGKTFLQWPGVFNRHAVVYVLKEVIAGQLITAIYQKSPNFL
jgi:hypothetical protein